MGFALRGLEGNFDPAKFMGKPTQCTAGYTNDRVTNKSLNCHKNRISELLEKEWLHVVRRALYNIFCVFFILFGKRMCSTKWEWLA